MHGLPLNLNGIRLKTTFPADTRRNPYNVCRPPRSPLPLPPPCPALDSRSYFHLTRFPRPTEPGISVKSPAFFVHRFSNGSPARDIVSTSRFEFRFRHRLAPLLPAVFLRFTRLSSILAASIAGDHVYSTFLTFPRLPSSVS